MQIHLSKISSIDGKVEHVSVPLEMSEISFQQGDFSIVKKSPVDLTITNTGNKVLEIAGRIDLSVMIPCDRCLTEVETDLSVAFCRKADLKLTEEERLNDLDESSYLTGMDLDVDQLVYLEVLMAWPLKVLCKEDCKGLCISCGKNLNEGPCDCKEEPKDPRMAAISDIFSKFKEV